MSTEMEISVIDLFAGPGGLSEGFHRHSDSEHTFRTCLAFEKDSAASQTLLLRNFFRSFDGSAPEEYYAYVRGEITKSELFSRYPDNFEKATNIVNSLELGNESAIDKTDRLIAGSIASANDRWVLVGGPPCQAYSLAGRSRMVGAIGLEEFEKDHRHFLYREYLRIIEKFRPPVFVMENVKGLISSKHAGRSMFERILADLSAPSKALNRSRNKRVKYKIVALGKSSDNAEQIKSLDEFEPNDFVLRAEEYGVPQKRHRVILLGVRSDVALPSSLSILGPRHQSTVYDVLSDLPSLTGHISARGRREIAQKLKKSADEIDFDGNLGNIVSDYLYSQLPQNIDHRFFKAIQAAVSQISSTPFKGGRFIKGEAAPLELADWYVDKKIGGFLNHESRSHIPSDLARYVFASSFALVNNCSPRLRDFPVGLLPKHKNLLKYIAALTKAVDGTELTEEEAVYNSSFNDRFTVQLANEPSSTVVSHISKDGHYYIHYDPAQCRSLSVREAARLQTFPDNYFFEGNRTQQYIQVGNAVPPLLACRISDVVASIIAENETNLKKKDAAE